MMKTSLSQLTDLHTDYLIASVSYATATEMSSLLEGYINHDKITHLLHSGYINSKLLWHKAKPICEETAMDDAVPIIDDSIEAKPYSDKSSLINWHFDHTAGRAVKGVNFMTAHYHSWEMSIPVNVQFVIKDRTVINKNGKSKNVSSIGKMQHFRNMVSDCAGKLSFRYVLNDSWYSSPENMKCVDDLDKYFIMPIKDNRKIAFMAYIKLERLKVKKGMNHFAMKSLLFKNAAMAAWTELYKSVA
jgi:hypothetical protein